ncbi:alpha/beta hydrolase [Methylobacterium komagatae]|uniref:Alpha/beta hydrolase n=1 Tax=Methylobacterium komagatae TaxID=374425 RepID=A0ABW2BMM1_9HYPH
MDVVNIGGVFGWYSPGHTRRAVVLCGTFGFEQHAAHRAWRDLSERIAETGCAVLRFDYPGEGDSEGYSVRIDTALDAIRRAIRFMREDPEIEEIVLVGLRLGGTLSALIAAETAVDKLVLLAPFAKGRSYLREMEIQGRLVDILPDGSPMPKRAGVTSVAGFRLEPELIAELSLIDLRDAGRPTARSILVLGPEHARLATQYRAQGIDVETGDLPNMSTLLMDAMNGQMHEGARAQIISFVSAGAEPLKAQPIRPKAEKKPIRGPGWTDEPLQFADGLFGVECRPQTEMAGAPVVLFVNFGVYVHSGYGRQTTTFARSLARSGIASLRMDLRGAGDSVDRATGDLPLFQQDALADVRAAVDELTRDSARPVIIVGNCSGAYFAFHAICEDRRIKAAALVNLYCFDWELTHGGVPYNEKPIRHHSAYVALLLNVATWRRILSGTTPVAKIAVSLAKRGLSRLINKVRCDSNEDGGPATIVSRIAGLRQRGAHVSMLYSVGDLGLVDLRTQLGSPEQASGLLGGPVHILPDADHSFSAESAQNLLMQELMRLATVCGANRYTDERFDRPAASAMVRQPQRTAAAAQSISREQSSCSST